MDAPPKSIHLDKRVSLDVAGLTHVGRERERNEDQFMIARLERTLRVVATSVAGAQTWLPGSAEGTVMLVADGMGGTAAGDVASRVAVQAIADYVVNVLPWADARKPKPAPESDYDDGLHVPEPTLYGIRSGLSKALVEGDAKVRKQARAIGATSMGTTLTVGYVQWPLLYVAHAGDSRCYLLRGQNLSQITTDHTLAEKLREHTDELGEIDESSPWHHVLWNALGGSDRSAIEPEVHREQLYYGDTIVLCSDGLTKHVTDAQIQETVKRAEDAHQACNALVELALHDGGTDNITVVVARCRLRDDTFDSEDPTRIRGKDWLDETLPMNETLPMAPYGAHPGATQRITIEDTVDDDHPIDSDDPTRRRKD